MAIRGERQVEIAAPIEQVFAIAADIEHAPVWQGSLKDVEVLSKDADGRAETVETESDAKVKRVKARLKFSYDEPTSITWLDFRHSSCPSRGSPMSSSTVFCRRPIRLRRRWPKCWSTIRWACSLAGWSR